MANEDLKPRQYKRVGRIAENNPERAERVAERLVTKSEREEKGKKIADKYSSSNKMPQAQYEKMKSDLKTGYDSINFKNKDIDKFKGKFGQDGVRDMGKTLTIDEVKAINKPKP
jgi:hypothetical protein